MHSSDEVAERGELSSLMQQFIRAREPDRSPGNELTPDPIVVMDDARRVEVGTVVQGMGVGDHDDIVMVRNGRSNRRINAEIGCPSRNEDPIGRNLLQAGREAGPGKGIVEGFLNDNIGRVAMQLGKQRPARCFRFEVITLAAAMLHEDDCA